jgi:hypothetical protein
VLPPLAWAPLLAWPGGPPRGPVVVLESGGSVQYELRIKHGHSLAGEDGWHNGIYRHDDRRSAVQVYLSAPMPVIGGCEA